MNRTTLFGELDLEITERSSVIGGIWKSETDLQLQEEVWFNQIYQDLKNHPFPTVVDVGSGTGCLSLFNKNIKFPIFSFEPNFEAFKELIMNVWNNKCNTLCYNLGLGEKTKVSYLTKHPELWGYGYNRVVDDKTEDQIDIAPLDLILPVNIEVTHVKIDVEGYEMFVLKGMDRILDKKPVLYLEMIESNFNQYGYGSDEILNFLGKYDYNYFQIDEHNYKFI